ncbi:MAG: saccharopine dehydrogenase NADP-binding domain-containing protein, partial [Promethearchaeota archaeon]
MSRIIVLGGCGIVGNQAVKALATSNEFDEIVIGDVNIKLANKYVREIGDSRLSSHLVDLTDSKMIVDAIKSSDVVLNCSGPFYKLGPI